MSRRTCINIGYDIDNFEFKTILNMRIGQCFKDLIQCFYNYDNWTGETATILQECKLSNPVQTTLWQDALAPEITKGYITSLGDGTDTAAGCWPGLFWTGGFLTGSPGPDALLSTLHHNAMMYIFQAAMSFNESESDLTDE